MSVDKVWYCLYDLYCTYMGTNKDKIRYCKVKAKSLLLWRTQLALRIAKLWPTERWTVDLGINLNLNLRSSSLQLTFYKIHTLPQRINSHLHSFASSRWAQKPDFSFHCINIRWLRRPGNPYIKRMCKLGRHTLLTSYHDRLFHGVYSSLFLILNVHALIRML